MARHISDIVVDIMGSGCIVIVDGVLFGALLGELLKMLEVSQVALERRTPEGLKEKDNGYS